MTNRFSVLAASLLAISAAVALSSGRQNPSPAPTVDRKVERFLDNHRNSWLDMNVPGADGRALFDIIVEHKYRRALEIGTSTGHSGIWIAWALSKTGGKLITIELDRDRHEQALANFREAGVMDYIDARLGDAHEIVRALPGPFDFVFSDADKGWYINYLKDLVPKLEIGGCFAAHNVADRAWGYNRDFLEYARSLPYLETTVFTRGAGMSLSYKRANK